ncbi:MAG: hypothetical protein DMG05_16575 [Acidobacteria bacterium]|nr:MAG: hypothetical protein DMG05_16575 [Acidobacteriota bacterium]
MTSSTNGHSSTNPQLVDFDIHGLVGIRLINPSSSDVAAVTEQLGPLRSPLSREPDIIVRFVECLATPRLRYLGLQQDGFTDDGFFLLQSKKKETKVRIDFEQIGEQCEIVCQSGLPRIPLLTAILNLLVLKKDCVALHASAFVYNGIGVLVTGWAKAGKTEALLAFAVHGAEYIGDEWVLLSGDGQKMYGVPESIHLWDWHLDYLPDVRSRVRREELLLFKRIHWIDKMQQKISSGTVGKLLPVKYLRSAMPALRRQLHVTMKPQTIFNSTLGTLQAKPDKIFLMMNHQDTTVSVEPNDPLTITNQMISSIRYEQLPFMSHYLAFKFAFPEKRNEFIENSDKLQYDILRRALAGKEAYTVWHHYPFSFHELFERMRPFCEAIAEPSGHGRDVDVKQEYGWLDSR